MTKKVMCLAAALALSSCSGGGTAAPPPPAEGTAPTPPQGAVAVSGQAKSAGFTLTFRIEPGGLSGNARGANFQLGGNQ